MLHGYLSNKESFTYQINFFSRFFRVVAVDMTGFGKSPPMEYPFSLDDYAEEIKRVLDELGAEKADVLAHSFGARVAVRLAGGDDRIDRIVFTGAAGLKPRRKIKYYLKRASFILLKKFVGKERLKSFYSSDYRSLDPIMQKSFIKIVNEHLDGEVGKLKNKCLIICGKKDKETPLGTEKRMKKLLENGKLYVIPSAGHFCFSEYPDEFNAKAFTFLTGNDI
ncbi:MAG TPA: hypothetical protein DDW54_03120 [Clostridiales bacterium]|nr:hypothetical protein [Clostridiales bacterium]